ncbi:MAG: glycosyltransferase family 2 protein [Thermoplasmata archaeon]
MNGSESKPYISVIITAHNREKYLKEAIESVLNQTLNRSLYEIIVVKNFENQEIDELIRKNEIINLKSELNSLVGEDLALGIEKAKGEIVCFLDDDDLFLPNKLKVVHDYFIEYKDLAYFHNAEYFIDENGNEVKFPVKDLNKNITLNKLENLNQIFELEKYGLFFNMSSICIRKNKIIPYIDKLKKINGQQDDFNFFTSISDMPNLIILSKEKLTKYRVHQSTTIHLYNNREEFINNFIKDKYNSLKLMELLNFIVKNNEYKAFINYRIIDYKIQLYFTGKYKYLNFKDLFLDFQINLKLKGKKYIKTTIYYNILFILSKIFNYQINEFYNKRIFNFINNNFNNYLDLNKSSKQ